MSEIREYDMDKNGRLLQQPDPTTASIDALRQAVVAQTALLRSLSEQVRLNQEAIVNWFSLNREQQAKVNNPLVGLAERLDLHGKMFKNIHDRLELYSGFPEALLQVKGHLQAIEAKLTASDGIRTALAHKQIILKDLQPKMAAARRKAKR